MNYMFKIFLQNHWRVRPVGHKRIAIFEETHNFVMKQSFFFYIFGRCLVCGATKKRLI